ncbi:Cuticular protein RR2 family member 26, partial [Caligus rogercresseyi]
GYGNTKYSFGYKVNGGPYGGNFGHKESSDGYGTQGEYHVHLPDGRLQTVNYSVDKGHSGY